MRIAQSLFHDPVQMKLVRYRRGPRRCRLIMLMAHHLGVDGTVAETTGQARRAKSRLDADAVFPPVLSRKLPVPAAQLSP